VKKIVICEFCKKKRCDIVSNSRPLDTLSEKTDVDRGGCGDRKYEVSENVKCSFVKQMTSARPSPQRDQLVMP